MQNDFDNKLIYSPSAISITHSFYNKKVMIYVEGDDDISFWDEIFRKCVPDNFYELEQVHGKENLPEYMDGIEDGSITNTIVACDSDYNSYIESGKYSSPFIIFTYGHSIENSMFCPHHIANYLKRQSHNTNTNYLDIVNIWINDFCNVAMTLLPYDIVSIKDKNGVKCMGCGCHRFLQNNSCLLDENKIREFINHVEDQFNKLQIQEVNNQLKKDDRDFRYIIQGHFFAVGVMNFIRLCLRQTNPRISLSDNALYGEFYSCNKYCNL